MFSPYVPGFGVCSTYTLRNVQSYLSPMAVEVTIWVSTALSANSSTSRWRDGRFRPWPWKRGALVEGKCPSNHCGMIPRSWGYPMAGWFRMDSPKRNGWCLEASQFYRTFIANNIQPLMWFFTKLLECWDGSHGFMLLFYQQVDGPPTIYGFHEWYQPTIVECATNNPVAACRSLHIPMIFLGTFYFF